MEPPWDGWTKVCSNGPDHMTQMAVMPVSKTLNNLLLRYQKADDLESWYAASGARARPGLFKWWSWVDLDLYYDRVKFGPLCFCMEKKLSKRYFRNYCSLWCQSWYMQVTKLVHEPIWISKVKVINLPWSKVTQIQHFKLLFLRNRLANWSQILCGVSMGWGMKDCSNGPGHITQMTAVRIYDKTILKSSLEPKGSWPWKLVFIIGY